MSLETKNEYLFQTLIKACSQNPIEIKNAELKIQELEIQPGYCINLFVSNIKREREIVLIFLF
jgi:hypothetical protein